MKTIAEKFYNKLEGSTVLKWINICNYIEKYPNSKLAKDLLMVWEKENDYHDNL